MASPTGSSNGGSTAHDIGYLYAEPLVSRADSGQVVAVPKLDTEGEAKTFVATLHASGKASTVCMVPATVKSLREVISEGCRVLHYTGHGSKSSLAFEDGCGGTHKLDAITLGRLITAGDGSCAVDLVVIMACHSEGPALAFREAGVPNIIAVRNSTEVNDAAAKDFMKQFYHDLLLGRPVQAAFHAAQTLILASSDAQVRNAAREADKFRLWMAKGRNHSRGTLKLPPGKPILRSPARPPENISAPPSPFVGRNTAVYEVVRHFLSGKHAKVRVLALVGPKGCGKTAVAMAAMEYILPRSFGKPWLEEGSGIYVFSLDRIRTGEVSIAGGAKKKPRLLRAALAEAMASAIPHLGTSRRHATVDTKMGRVSSESATWSAVVHEMRSHSHVLVLDGARRDDDGILQDILDQCRGISILVTARESPSLHSHSVRVMKYAAEGSPFQPLSARDGRELLRSCIAGGGSSGRFEAVIREMNDSNGGGGGGTDASDGVSDAKRGTDGAETEADGAVFQNFAFQNSSFFQSLGGNPHKIRTAGVHLRTLSLRETQDKMNPPLERWTRSDVAAWVVKENLPKLLAEKGWDGSGLLRLTYTDMISSELELKQRDANHILSLISRISNISLSPVDVKHSPGYWKDLVAFPSDAFGGPGIRGLYLLMRIKESENIGLYLTRFPSRRQRSHPAYAHGDLFVLEFWDVVSGILIKKAFQRDRKRGVIVDGQQQYRDVKQFATRFISDYYKKQKEKSGRRGVLAFDALSGDGYRLRPRPVREPSDPSRAVEDMDKFVARSHPLLKRHLWAHLAGLHGQQLRDLIFGTSHVTLKDLVAALSQHFSRVVGVDPDRFPTRALFEKFRLGVERSGGLRNGHVKTTRDGRISVTDLANIGVFQWLSTLVKYAYATGSLLDRTPHVIMLSMTRIEVETKLRQHPIGSFIIRVTHSNRADQTLPVLCFSARTSAGFAHVCAGLAADGCICSATTAPLALEQKFGTLADFLSKFRGEDGLSFRFLVDVTGTSEPVDGLNVATRVVWDPDDIGAPKWAAWQRVQGHGNNDDRKM